ncbi:MAG: hypothetical protein WBP81_23080 [Solirubrobacteraceae bacterium]
MTSAPACTFPLPETVDWTTPVSAVTISRDVRAELLGGPTSMTANAATATAASASA